MKIYDTVKTRGEALNILNIWIADNATNDAWIDDISVQCECGETPAFTTTIQTTSGDKSATIAYCDACGDDNAMTRNILFIN